MVGELIIIRGRWSVDNYRVPMVWRTLTAFVYARSSCSNIQLQQQMAHLDSWKFICCVEKCSIRSRKFRLDTKQSSGCPWHFRVVIVRLNNYDIREITTLARIDKTRCPLLKCIFSRKSGLWASREGVLFNRDKVLAVFAKNLIDTNEVDV